MVLTMNLIIIYLGNKGLSEGLPSNPNVCDYIPKRKLNEIEATIMYATKSLFRPSSRKRTWTTLILFIFKSISYRMPFDKHNCEIKSLFDLFLEE